MTILLRGHHLLCLLTYIGLGYDDDFIAGMNTIINRLSQGESICLVEGADDICAPFVRQHQSPHCYYPRLTIRDHIAIQDLKAHLGLPIELSLPFRLDALMLQAMRCEFVSGMIRRACNRCEWAKLCTQIACNQYTGVRLTLEESAIQDKSLY